MMSDDPGAGKSVTGRPRRRVSFVGRLRVYRNQSVSRQFLIGGETASH